MKRFENVQEFYKHLDSFAEELKNTNLQPEGKQLKYLMHKVAWTTGSELLNELREILIKIKQNTLSEKLKNNTEDCILFINEICSNKEKPV